MSDLQCPARLWLAAKGPLGPLLQALAGERVSAVLTGSRESTLVVAGPLAAALASGVMEVRAGLDDTGTAVHELADAADAFRGEAVVVVADAKVVAEVVGDLVPGVGVRPLSPGEVVGLEADGDGWVLGSWPGSAT